MSLKLSMDMATGGADMLAPVNDILKKSQLVGILEHLGQELEPTQTQYDTAKDHYEAVGRWLAEADHPFLRSVSIYPQGSMSLQTVTKPLANDEYDVDLVCFVPDLHPNWIPPHELKKLIGARLKDTDRYAKILEEKPRCWRINYANQFHLDITPSIPNPECHLGGELVPDKRLREWKASNPKGYRDQFTTRAAMQPVFHLKKAELSGIRAQVEALPEPAKFKGLLRRSVQLLKRHRDIWFSAGTAADLAPISIIITTLASRSYEYCVTHFVYDTELDVLLDVIRYMPSFVETHQIHGQKHYFVWNETTDGENFAEKWNHDPRLPEAFYIWHRHVLADFEGLTSQIGLDRVQDALAKSFGDRVAMKAMAASTTAVSNARSSGLLTLAPGAGLLSVSPKGVAVRNNTFFGAPQGDG